MQGCTCQAYRIPDKDVVVRLSEEDVDVLGNIKLFNGRTRRVFFKGVQMRCARYIAQRMLGRPLKEGENAIMGDRDPLHLCRTNIRVVDNRTKGYYKLPHRDTASIYKGVYWNKRNQKWCAQIGPKKTSLGYFDTEKDAARAYNKAVDALGIDLAYRNPV